MCFGGRNKDLMMVCFETVLLFCWVDFGVCKMMLLVQVCMVKACLWGCLWGCFHVWGL